MIIGKSWLVRAAVGSIHIGLRQSRDTLGAVLNIATDVVVSSTSQLTLGKMVDWSMIENRDWMKENLKENIENCELSSLSCGI